MLLVVSAVIGGCAGSPLGGLKAIRVLVLSLQATRELNHLVHPNLVQPLIKFDAYFAAARGGKYLGIFDHVLICLFNLCIRGYLMCMEPYDAIGGVLATLTNAGPGLGATSQTFAHTCRTVQNSYLLFAMVCGRLELFSLLVLFNSAFWKT